MTSYFYIPLTAKSEEELYDRIMDNEKRGFELFKIKKPENNGIKSTFIKDGKYSRYRNLTFEHHVKFEAVMRKKQPS